MEKFQNILVVSRSTSKCARVLQTGIALARKFDAALHILHIIHDPFSLEGWNLPIPSLVDEYRKMVADARKKIDALVEEEKNRGLTVTERVESGDPAEEIEKVVASENVDLILMLAHKEGHLEHFLFGKTNDAIVRKLPATLMLVK
ncbi:MAG: universal stress protein [Deltaproteobacteria bacterium]|jgi:nucleotide-binding universal stress UspA family protein